MIDFCFEIQGNKNVRDTDFELLFRQDDHIIMLEPDMTMADVMVVTGIYPTKSKAKKDGWFKPIPSGWYDEYVGKRRTRISIWNPSA
jgi:hypothetical protein